MRLAKLATALVCAISLVSAVPAAAKVGSWTRTPVPISKGDIAAVAALTDRDAWAVGYRLRSTTSLQAVALRWNGTGWAQESALPAETYPQALAVRSATDIWEVGSGSSHWNGRTWTKHALERGMVPEAVAAVPGGGVLAVGMNTPGSIKDGVPDVQSWDGTRWRRQVLPQLGKGGLTSIAALAPDDVWAAGYTTGGTQTTLVVHWDGRTWRKVDAPSAVGANTWISGLTAVGPGEVWAVGGSVKGSAERPFVMRWDGRAWTATQTPDVADGRLRAVGRTGGGELWAVGGKGSVTVALRWNATARRWDTESSPDISVRGFAAVPQSGGLWAVGIARQGDLVPAIARYD
ncbi:hypothetical protein [Allokutzneria oryzae]|uniref:Uncharacterized protein n=1 Tax=Allokutzneria oryzae TaxID=1378989 RepID=A0ABV6A8K8_9PSEU